MLTVVTPATSTRLTTVERARAMLGFGADENTKVGMLIDQASDAAATFCRRVFAAETVKESFVYAPARTGALLDRSPVTQVVSVSGDGVTIDPTGYVYDDLIGGLFALNGTYRHGWRYRLTEITYTAGYTLPSDTPNTTWTLPASVERAVILLVGAYRSSLSRDPLVKSESTDGIGSTSWWVPGSGDKLPDPEAERLLRPFRRVLLG